MRRYKQSLKRRMSQRKAAAKYRAEMTAEARRIGFCVGCFKVPALIDRVLCAACKESMDRRRARRREAAKLKGCCTSCLWRKPKPGGAICGPCARYNTRYEKRQAAEARAAKRATERSLLAAVAMGPKLVHEVAADLPVSYRTVMRWLSSLETDGLLERFCPTADDDYVMVRLRPPGRAAYEGRAA